MPVDHGSAVSIENLAVPAPVSIRLSDHPWQGTEVASRRARARWVRRVTLWCGSPPAVTRDLHEETSRRAGRLTTGGCTPLDARHEAAPRGRLAGPGTSNGPAVECRDALTVIGGSSAVIWHVAAREVDATGRGRSCLDRCERLRATGPGGTAQARPGVAVRPDIEGSAAAVRSKSERSAREIRLGVAEPPALLPNPTPPAGGCIDQRRRPHHGPVEAAVVDGAVRAQRPAGAGVAPGGVNAPAPRLGSLRGTARRAPVVRPDGRLYVALATPVGPAVGDCTRSRRRVDRSLARAERQAVVSTAAWPERGVQAALRGGADTVRRLRLLSR